MRLKKVPNIGKAIAILEGTGLLKEFFPILVGQALPFMEKATELIPNIHFEKDRGGPNPRFLLC